MSLTCYNASQINAPAMLQTSESVAELVTVLRRNESDMTEPSTPPSPSQVIEKVWTLNIPAPEKLFLIAIADQVPFDGTRFRLPIKFVMARTNSTRDTLSRIIGCLKKKGILTLEGQTMNGTRFGGYVYTANLDAVFPGREGGYVYVIESNGLFKIGRSVDPEKRLRQISGSIKPLTVEFKLVHTIKSDNADIAERRLHALYRNQRRDGEWFELSEENLKEIKSLTEL